MKKEFISPSVRVVDFSVIGDLAALTLVESSPDIGEDQDSEDINDFFNNNLVSK